MLKDSGRLVGAEAVYRQALAQVPNDTDSHLQLGHAVKLQGRHNDAIAAYRRAAELRPDNAEASRELFFAGSLDDQHQLFEPPPNCWTPLMSSDGSGKVSNGPATASSYGSSGKQ